MTPSFQPAAAFVLCACLSAPAPAESTQGPKSGVHFALLQMLLPRLNTAPSPLTPEGTL